jgi:Alw26I/Eco31I/Esp3I family type II restriction m6 adenine DNA methyltransferase
MGNGSLEAASERVQKLAQVFDENKRFYLSTEYQESEVRKDFIDKFFIALGWDVNHETQKNPFKQEVKVERGIVTGPSQRHTDYAFYIDPNFRDPRLFAEAKKPASDLSSADNCYQTIRYGWNAGMRVVVLTNFEQLIILDCRYKPDIDTATEQIIQKYHYLEYCKSEKFAEIYYLFSHDAIAASSLEQYAEKLPKRRGKAIQRGLFKGGWQPVDESFLEELDSYRDVLAKNFKNHNPELDAETLTEVTQRTLDRLVFLRFLEDKLIEAEPHVSEFGVTGHAWKEFVVLAHRLDHIYNGVVFKKHDILDAPDFKVDETQFGDLCEELAHVNSPYDFNFIPIHILGSIYERFLGKVIVVTDKRAHVEEKPEVRKAGGVYYTPDYIVRYIVENTVGKLIDGKTPAQIAKMRFADIACGSGSFLLGIYDLLLRYYRDWFNENPTKAEKAGCVKRDDGYWHLSLKQKREILLSNIYGVDIDHQAIEVAQLSLYLKLLEEETTASARQYQLELHETILPPLDKNIVCGNSLIERDILEGQLFPEDEERKVNPMNFEDHFAKIMKDGGFDAIVGNPPYDVMEKERGESSWPHSALSNYVRIRKDYEAALGGKLNLFRFFIVRSLSLIKKKGRFGFIVPLALLADISCARTRRHLLLSTINLAAECFPQKDNPNRRVFRKAKLSTVVITASRASSGIKRAAIRVRVYPWNSFEDTFKECTISLLDAELLDPDNIPIPLVSAAHWRICRKIHLTPRVVRLGQFQEFSVTRGEINQTIYREFITNDNKMSRLVKGVEVGQYVIHSSLTQGVREWFDEKMVLRGSPPKPIVQQRRIATQRITGVDERLRIVATIIEPPAYFADSTNSITIADGEKHCLEYLLALLNSKLFQWRFKLTSTNNNVATNEINCMPFRVIDFSNKMEKIRYGRLVALVGQMFAGRQKLATAKTDKDKNYYESKCASLNSQIDQLVYELYGLSEDEIKIIEETK